MNKFNIFKHFGRLPINFIDNFNAMLGVKARPLLRKLLLGVASVCKVRVSKTKLSGIAYMVTKISILRRRNGPKGLTLYLKTAFVMYQQALGGQVLPNVAAVSGCRPSRNNQGLPRLIPAALRKEIRLGNLGTMKLISSILNLYRDINYPGAPKLNTITGPYTGDETAVEKLQIYILPFLKAFFRRFLQNSEQRVESLSVSRLQFLAKEGIQWKGRRLFMIWKAAPGMIKDELFGSANYSAHPYNVLRSFISLFKNPKLWRDFKYLAQFIEHRALNSLVKIFEEKGLGMIPFKGPVGKLHAKEEPAGKVRLFAMVDAPTQWVLYPLHEFIMEQLREIPQDGTFNQTKPLGALIGSKCLYSYDLTAATDRLPIALQKDLLRDLLGGEFASAWSNMLVGRTYGFHQLGYSKYHGNYRYAVGQPMGAYSSWAMLALTHHFLVQVSAWRSGVTPIGTWFKAYAVLGDDLVLADKAVAGEYLVLLKELGMPVNLHKSLVSENGTAMEFAKRTLWKGNDISPVPLKEMSAAQGLAPAMVSFAAKYALTLPQLLASFQVGWRNISWLSKPLNKLPSQIRTLVLAMAMPKDLEEVPRFFAMGSHRANKTLGDLMEIGQNFAQTAVMQLVQRVERKLVIADSVVKAKDANLELMKENFPTTLGRWLFGRDPELLDSQLFIEGEGFIMKLVLGETSQDVLDSKAKEYVIRRMTDQHEIGLHMFFFMLLHLLYGRYQSDYKELMLYVLQDLRGLSGRVTLLPNSVLLTSRALRVAEGYKAFPDTYGFFHRYWDVLRALDELASASPAVLEFERPDGSEGVALGYNAVTPVQIRYYRLWSGVVQGASPLLSLSVKPNAVVPNGLTPSEVSGKDAGDWT